MIQNETPGWDLLAEVALARRHRLGMTQRQVADTDGPSAPTLRALETQSSRMNSRSLRKLETALGWSFGTATTLVEGLHAATEADWQEFVYFCIHQPVETRSKPGPESSQNDPAHEAPCGMASRDQENQVFNDLEVSLAHSTVLLSQLAQANSSRDDSTFREHVVSLHQLLRLMHHTVLKELVADDQS